MIKYLSLTRAASDVSSRKGEGSSRGTKAAPKTKKGFRALLNLYHGKVDRYCSKKNSVKSEEQP